MLRSIIITLFIFTGVQCLAQPIEASYQFSGMGSNFGQDWPVFKISNGRFVYTREITSYWKGQELPPPDTLLTGVVNSKCLEGLAQLLKENEEGEIYETNINIMSGGIHYIELSSPVKSIQITLHNSWHPLAKQIVDLLNLNIPEDLDDLWLNDPSWYKQD